MKLFNHHKTITTPIKPSTPVNWPNAIGMFVIVKLGGALGGLVACYAYWRVWRANTTARKWLAGLLCGGQALLAFFIVAGLLFESSDPDTILGCWLFAALIVVLEGVYALSRLIFKPAPVVIAAA